MISNFHFLSYIMRKPECRFYNTDTTDYWRFYPEEGDKINLTSIGALFTKKKRLVSTEEIFRELDENGIDGLEFYFCELEDKSKDVLQKRIINKMKYIKLYSVKGNLFDYIPEKLEKLIIFEVQIYEEFSNFLLNKNLKYKLLS